MCVKPEAFSQARAPGQTEEPFRERLGALLLVYAIPKYCVCAGGDAATVCWDLGMQMLWPPVPGYQESSFWVAAAPNQGT